jgi:GDP-L-fucose synthase
VDDLADACVFLMQQYESDEPINVGVGVDLTIAELARTVAAAVGFEGRLVFDPSKPDGTPRKLLDTSKINALGWAARIPLDAGIAGTCDWFRENQASLRG